MLEGNNLDVAEYFEDPLNFRLKTLQEVLMGQMTPPERRFELAQRRRKMLFGAGVPLAGGSPKRRTEQGSSTEEPEPNSSGFKTADSVEIEVESPSEDEIRVANFLAEEYPDAEAIALSGEDTLEVREAPGGTFVVSATDVREREFGESSETETVEAPIPTMSTAATEKFS
jgi:hypothetical protein